MGSSDPDDTAKQETAEWSADGTGAEAAQAVADPPLEVAADEAAESTDVSPAAEAVPAETAVDDGSAFLDELVRAMQTTATAEKARIAADIDRRRETHLATVEARREAEAAEIRALADEDLKAIDAWAESERTRIQEERERRAAALESDLQTSLATHAAKIDQEIEGVEAAIAGYRSEVDAFFATLVQETDPVAIARHASQRPAFPVLDAPAEAVATEAVATEAADAEPDGPADAVAAHAAAADATAADADAPMAETSAEPAADVPEARPAPVAVMEPRSAARLAESWAAWSGISAAPASTELEADIASADGSPDGSVDESNEPIQLEPAAVVSGKGKVLQSVPSSRPMSWLRRDHDTGDRQNGDR